VQLVYLSPYATQSLHRVPLEGGQMEIRPGVPFPVPDREADRLLNPVSGNACMYALTQTDADAVRARIAAARKVDIATVPAIRVAPAVPPTPAQQAATLAAEQAVEQAATQAAETHLEALRAEEQAIEEQYHIQ
jgi:hypothetical protein